LLGDLVETPPVYWNFPEAYSSKGIWRVSTVSRPQIAVLHRQLYDDDGRRHISRPFLDQLTPLSLDLWYLDDGSLVTQAHPYQRRDGTVAHYPATRSIIGIYSLSLGDAHLIQRWLQERWGVEGGVTATAKGPVIWLTLAGTERLHQLIAPYVPPTMAYKLLPAYRNQFCPPTDNGMPAGLAVSVVKQIERVLAPDYVYNIEVADNHNYFVRDILVANCHMLTKEAFNALLKTLEEPPPHAVFVLATTEPDRVPETVRSRCQRFDFRRIPTAEIVEHLTEIVKSEGAKAAPEALVAIARRATGSMRDAVSLLDQLLSYSDDILELARVEKVLGLVNTQTIGRLVDFMAANDPAGGLALLNQLVAEGVELGQLTDQVVAYLRAVLFVRVARAPELLDLAQDVVSTVARQAEALTPGVLLTGLREFMDARAALRDQIPGAPQLPIELAFLRSTLPRAAQIGTDRAASEPATTASPPSRPAAGGFPAPAQGAQRGTPIAPGDTHVAAGGPAAAGRGQRTAVPQTAVQPQKPAPQPAPEPLPAAERDVGLLQAAQATWDQLLAMAGKRCGMKVQAALRSVQGLDIAGQIIVLRFAHTFSRDLVGSAENRAKVEELWSEVLDRKVQVRCGLVGEVSVASSSAQPAKPAPAKEGVNDDEAFLQGARKLGAVVKKLD
jgi:DNA polymerase-3 subunit gamma/tau